MLPSASCASLAAMPPRRTKGVLGGRSDDVVRRVLAAAVAELARREAAARRPAPAVRRAGADGENLLALIARWAAPTLAAATVLAALSAAGLALARRDSGAIVETRAPAETLVGALELPEPASTWLVEDRSPGTDDLILAVQEDLP
ncbi:MAG TPA: hypothetical protein VIC56_09510 [Gemmatimonadota bacterium]